jgi:hypothetical protein
MKKTQTYWTHIGKNDNFLPTLPLKQTSMQPSQMSRLVLFEKHGYIVYKIQHQNLAIFYAYNTQLSIVILTNPKSWMCCETTLT